MDFGLTDEQRLLRDTVRDFARQEVAPVAEELDREKRFPYEIVEKLGELGIMGIPHPTEYGGGGGLVTIEDAIEQIVGDIDENMTSPLAHDLHTVNLTEMFGSEKSHAQVLRCIEDAAHASLTTR